MSSDKMREEFEAWYLAEYYEGYERCGLEWLSTEPCGGYRYTEPAKLWKTWQASRAALVIDLPKINPVEWACTSDECMAMQQGISMAGRAILAAGLKVKP